MGATSNENNCEHNIRNTLVEERLKCNLLVLRPGDNRTATRINSSTFAFRLNL